MIRLAAIGACQRIDAEDLDRAGVGLEQAGDHAQRGGLAGAVRPEQRVEFTGADREIEVLNSGAG